jgi:hypothetical protein
MQTCQLSLRSTIDPHSCSLCHMFVRIPQRNLVPADLNIKHNGSKARGGLVAANKGGWVPVWRIVCAEFGFIPPISVSKLNQVLQEQTMQFEKVPVASANL